MGNKITAETTDEEIFDIVTGYITGKGIFKELNSNMIKEAIELCNQREAARKEEFMKSHIISLPPITMKLGEKK